MKDKQLRKQLADSLCYYKKLYEDWYERPYTMKTIQEWNTNIDGDITLQTMLEVAEENGYSLDELVVDGFSQKGWDDYDENFIQLVVKEPSTDKEWFDDVANSLSPQWEYDRYKQYLELKKEYK